MSMGTVLVDTWRSLYQRLYLHDVVIEKEASDFSQDDLVSTGSSESENLNVTSILQKDLSVKQQNKTNKRPVGEDTSLRGVSMRTVPIDTMRTVPIDTYYF